MLQWGHLSRTKALGQRAQLKGFSPVWILECTFRWPCCAKDNGHRVQLNGFSPVWILKCFTRAEDAAVDVVQWSKVSVAAGISCLKFDIEIFNIKNYLYASIRKLQINPDKKFKIQNTLPNLLAKENNNNKRIIHIVQSAVYSMHSLLFLVQITITTKYFIKLINSSILEYCCLCTYIENHKQKIYMWTKGYRFKTSTVKRSLVSIVHINI